MNRYLGAAVLVAVGACAHKPQTPVIQTALATHRDIVVEAQGNGTLEPITVIDVKSKASGVITKMPVETGTHVKPGDLIVQIDTRDVQNKYDQAKAALDAAQAKLQVAEADKKRNEEMFKARVITPQEFEQIAVSYENAKSGVVSAKANLDLAKQSLEEATVNAPSEGTVITKNVSEGTVIASATGSVSGGTTIVQMADLNLVRIRAYFNESDIGNVHPGEPANVTIDAYPDRRFTGVVDKIEPQAVVQQNVTMFPVLVNLENREGLLKVGMNGEVSVLIDERDNVLAIPNDAIKNPREAVATGAMLGLNSDTVQAELRAQGFSGGSRGGGFGGRRGNGGNGGPRGSGSGTGSAGGDVAFAQQAQQAGSQGVGGFQQSQPSDADCKKVDDVLKAHPKEKKQLDSLRAEMQALRPTGFGSRSGGFGGANRNRGGAGGGQSGQGAQGGGQGASGQGEGGFRGSPEMQAINQQTRAIYTALNLDPRAAGSCLRRQAGGPNGAQYAASGRPGGVQGHQGGALTPSPEMGGRPARIRPGLVYVTDSAKTVFHPRIVQLGQGNLDYTEVVSGLKEGDRVVMLGALALQAQRLQNQDRARANASPLGGTPGPGGGGPRGGRGG